jgi:hypothetical protein
MKTFYNLILYLLLICSFSFAQQASGYFPSQTGFTWQYLLTPLDSANNGINQLAFYRADSFANIADYKGMQANIVLSKKGSLTSLPSQPYDDSLFSHFEGMNAFEYSQTSNMEFLLRSLDSLSIDPNFSFLDFFISLENWYSLYRFDQPVQNNYTILSVDTVLQAGALTLPLRFEYVGVRFEDVTINTQIGSVNCKKFMITRGVSLIITPINLIPLATIEDTMWIAPDNWIVKSFSPSGYVNLSLIGADPIFVPGMKTEITETISDVQNNTQLPADIRLYQNYPNPFNPKTNIAFTITELEFVNLKVFDAMGKEIQTLVNRELPAGNHSVKFEATGLASGFYFYRLQSGNFSEIKKMVFLK